LSLWQLFVIIAGFPENLFVCFGASTLAGAIDQRRVPRKSIMKRTYQASKVRRARTHGFLVRMKTRGGRAVINARRAKGRKRLAV
jgi:large subunit ribosomal protein L34